MSDTIAPWLVIAGLGAFHGINPAMGWLFAVALGLHRQSRRVVWLSLFPIAAGHAASVLAVLFAVVLSGFVANMRMIEFVAAALLIVAAAYHALYGHRRRVRVGMKTGMSGLAIWSFLMATAHGAGLMLVPVVLPLCLVATPARELTAEASLPVALAALGVHMSVMLLVIAVVAGTIYEWVGLSFLRRGWINLDLIWSIALVAAALFLLL